MATQEEKTFFQPPWFKEFHIKGFDLNADYFDTGGFIGELKENLTEGYDRAKPITLAKSRDTSIRGEVLDGRHRLYVGHLILKATGKLPDFVFAFRDVPDMDTLHALRAEYERKNRSKDAKVSKQWVDANVRDIVEKNLHLESKLPSYVLSKGFTNSAVINRIIREQRFKRDKGTKKVAAEVQQARVDNFVKKLRNEWGVNSGAFEDNRISGTGKRESLADDNPDFLTSYQHSCPRCKTGLKILTNKDGSVVRVEQGMTISR